MEKAAEEVRDPMEHLELAFKQLDQQISDSEYLIAGDNITYFDIMVWHEVS